MYLRDEEIQLDDGQIGIVRVTDSAACCKKALEQKMAVLALLTQENREEDFTGVLYACEDPAAIDTEFLMKVYQRYHGLPWEILTTERCLVRETTEADVDSFYEMYADPQITRYTEGLFPEREKERQYVRDYIRNVYSFYGFGIWTILDRRTGAVIGRAGLTMREGFEDPEIGFVIASHRQREGLATEVCGAILEYGRTELEFQKIRALVLPDNTASLKLCDRLGMRDEEEITVGGVRYLQRSVTF